MPATVETLLEKIRELEEEVARGVEETRRQFRYTLVEKRVRFEETVRQQHRRLRTTVSRFVSESPFAAIFAAPFVYALIVPLIFLDLFVTLFQALCFPVYGIAKVPRADFIVIDRHHLAYLNWIEKLNCVYCGYANGLIAFVREVASRAEEHWCPVKHARQPRSVHLRYFEFAEYGDAEGYRRRKEAQRTRNEETP
jgi:hypothetical protein